MRYLTDAELQQDLNDLYERLSDAKFKLRELPRASDVGSWVEKKKLKKKKDVLWAEIRHVQRLIAYGQEALSNNG